MYHFFQRLCMDLFSSCLWWHRGQKHLEKTHSYQKPYNFTIVSWCWGTETRSKLNMVTKTVIPFKPLEIWKFSFTPTYLNNVLNIQRSPYSESRSSSLLYGLCHDCTSLTHWCADSESGHSRHVTFSRHLFPCHETSPLVLYLFSPQSFISVCFFLE